MQHTWCKGKMAWLVALFMALFLIPGCSPAESNAPSRQEKTNAAASWPYPFVKIEDRVYVIQTSGEGKVAKELIGEQIGRVEMKYEFEGEEGTAAGTVIVSNYLEEGTKLFVIKGVDQSASIAIEAGEDEFFQATEEGVFQKEKSN
ncbi:hypothetical protein [Brevibacillus reuszeri]|uniref:hypothetical protein n=1 Tax=Brevibacillus reuszeri TaxID=54915 RepID=UPI0028A15D37|nr:hypothetical protein [Brevibacillus reuszeri]